jgi:hypothetical protein
MPKPRPQPALRLVDAFQRPSVLDDPRMAESKAKAQEGRDLRNEGRVEDGKAPKTTKPGTGHPEK